MVRIHSPGRRGFTLVEMMIAMIITLMIVFAMVQAFKWVGETTTEGRAVIEMLGQIRHARFRWEDDWTRRTVPGALTPPCLDSRRNGGYVEIIEGPGSDSVPGRYLVEVNGQLVYNTFDFVTDPTAANWATILGDLDDIGCVTIRNEERPFTGRLAVHPGNDGAWFTNDDICNIIESPVAEVVWWAELNDRPGEDTDNDGTITGPSYNAMTGVVTPGEGGTGVWNPGETFVIRRRVLLVRPDLNLATTHTLPGSPGGFTAAQAQQIVAAFLLNNDISVAAHADPNTHAYTGLQANSLGDLSLRHNRVAHDAINWALATPPTPMNPYAAPWGQSAAGSLSPLQPSFLPKFRHPDYAGEDVVLSGVTAFDLRVWEPNAPICSFPAFNPVDAEIPEGLVPGDPGYVGAITTPNGSVANIVGFGAFVDLGVFSAAQLQPPGPTNPFTQTLRTVNGLDENGILGADDAAESAWNPLFLGAMSNTTVVGPGGFVYDPWPIDYENDGLDQDANGTADQGVYYLDGSLNGDYDTAERETLPPYPQRLSSLQMRLRVYEPDTRQVKQMSQVIKFGD